MSNLKLKKLKRSTHYFLLKLKGSKDVFNLKFNINNQVIFLSIILHAKLVLL